MPSIINTTAQPPADNVPPMGLGNGPKAAPPADTQEKPPMQMPDPNARIEVNIGISGQEYADLIDTLQQAGMDDLVNIFQQAVQSDQDQGSDENSPEQLADEISAMGASKRG